MKVELVKHMVCANCLSIGISDPNCICTFKNSYDTIELEFEMCSCCFRPISDQPADSAFNISQLNS
jgi:hypothetical protein